MSTLDSAPEVESAEEPVELTLRRMVCAIDYAEGFWLGFAKSNTPAQRRRLAALCKDLLEPLKIRVLEIELNEPVTDLLPVLRERLAQEANNEESTTTRPKLAIFVHGLERSIPSREAHPPLLSALNLKRELFRQEVPHPLLLWLPDYALTALARKAPDFWAWRSGLYEFAPEREEAELSLETVSGEAIHVTQSLSEQAKRERLIMLKGLLDDYRELGDGHREQQAQASILQELGLIHEMLNEWSEAKQAFKESYSVSSSLRDRKGMSISIHQLGTLAREIGDYDEARQLYSDGLKLARELDDKSGIASALGELGSIASFQGNLTEAQQLYNECLNISKELGDQNSISITLNHLARIAKEQGNYAEARRYYGESLEINKKLNNQRGIASTHWGLGSASLEEGRLDEATVLLQEALKALKRLGDQAGVAGVLHQLGRLAQNQGNIDMARKLYNESLEITQRLGIQHSVAGIKHQLGRLAEIENDKAEAARLFSEALAIFERLGSPYADVARQSLIRVDDPSGVSR